jgi:hypothetical protein
VPSTDTPPLTVIAMTKCGIITTSVNHVPTDVTTVKTTRTTVYTVKKTESMLQLVTVQAVSSMMDQTLSVQNVTVNVTPVPEVLIPV